MIALIGDQHVGYDDVGSGEPLLFIHGFPLRRSIWGPQLGGLVDRARCIAPDLRGFGETPAAPPHSMDRYADDLADLMAHLRIDRAVVCGLSMGGYVAFSLWRRHPQLVRGLVLMGTRAGDDAQAAKARRRELMAVAADRGPSGVADHVMPGMLGKGTRDRNPGLGDATHAMLETASVEGIVGALEAMIAREDSVPTLGTITVPTLVVVGDEDVLTPVEDARAMHAGIAGSHLEVIAGAGHLANIERPAAVNHILSEFLASFTWS